MAIPRFDPTAGLRPVFLEYLRVLYRRRWLAAAMLLLVVAAAAAYTYRAVPIYQAQVSILIDIEEPQVLQFQKVLDETTASADSPQTQYELLRSRALVQRTVAEMQLWKRPEMNVNSEAAAVDAVRRGLDVVPIRGTRMAYVRFRWTEPRLAAEVVNAHARQYVEQTMQKRFVASQEATEFLDRQLAAEQERVRQAEAALQAFREQHDALSLDQGQNIVVQKLADLNAAVTRAKTERIERETQFRELRAAQQNPAALDGFPAILANGFVQELKAQIATLQREYAQLSETLGERHPTMVEKRTALTTAEARLAAEIGRVVQAAERAYQAAAAAEDRLTAALDEQKRESLALSRRGIEYAALQREAESVRLVYQSLLQRAKETNVAGNLRSTNVQIIDPAEPPRRPIYPRTALNLAMAALLGGLLALGTVFAVELADDRVKVPDDITYLLGQPVLGFVPRLKRRGGRQLTLLEPSADVLLVEAFRGLRTNLTARLPGPEARTLLVASGAEREGKTHVAGNLALALAQAGSRVVVLDADMRRPRLHSQLGLPVEPGLAEVLAGTAALAEALQPVSGQPLTVISAGRDGTRAPELLGSPAFTQLLDMLREHYEWIVIDSPPLLTVTDAAVIASRVRGVLLVIGSDLTRGQAARLAVERVEQGGGQVIGTVLNRADVLHHPYYFSEYASNGYLHSLQRPAEEPSSAPTSLLGRGV